MLENVFSCNFLMISQNLTDLFGIEFIRITIIIILYIAYEAEVLRR